MEQPQKQLTTTHKIELFKKFVDLEYYDGLSLLFKEPLIISKTEFESMQKHTQNTNNKVLQDFLDKKLFKTRNYVLKNVESNTQNFANNTPDSVLNKILLQATKKKNFELFYEIAKERPNIKINYPSASVNNLTPLHLICTFGTKEQVQAIIDLGVDIHAISDKETNAAHFAISSFNIQALEILKNNGFLFKNPITPGGMINKHEMYYIVMKNMHHQTINGRVCLSKTSPYETLSNYSRWSAAWLGTEEWMVFTKQDFVGLAELVTFLKTIEPNPKTEQNKNLLHNFFEYAAYGDFPGALNQDTKAALELVEKLTQLNALNILKEKDTKGKTPLDYIKNKKFKEILKDQSELLELKTLPSNKNLGSKKVKVL